MRRIAAVAVTVAVGLAAFAGSARAQFGSLEKPVSIGVRAGGYFPSSRPDGMSKNWMALGADVRVNISAIPIVGGQNVALDYLKRGDSNITGLTFVQRFSAPLAVPVGPGGIRPYGGVGFGYYRVHVETSEQSKSKSSVGVKAMAGLDIGKGLYVQGDYHLPATGNVLGLNPKGFALTAGVRF